LKTLVSFSRTGRTIPQRLSPGIRAPPARQAPVFGSVFGSVFGGRFLKTHAMPTPRR